MPNIFSRILSGRVEMLAPDVIVVTGDLADRPAYDGLLRARDYLIS